MGLRRVPERLVGLDDLVEGEPVRHELLDRQLVLRHELEQHRQRRGVDQPHADGDVLDPEVLELELHRRAVHTDVRHVAARAHQLGAHL